MAINSCSLGMRWAPQREPKEPDNDDEEEEEQETSKPKRDPAPKLQSQKRTLGCALVASCLEDPGH